jgi:hypothetical protein
MKRKPLAAITLSILAVAACSNSSTNKNRNANNSAIENTNAPVLAPLDPPKPSSAPDPNFQPCNSYYPLVPGSTKKYTLNYSSGITADITIVVDLVEENGRKVFVETTQIIDQTGGLHKAAREVRKYICDAGKVQLISEKIDERIEGKPGGFEAKINTPAVMMLEPSALKPGASWSFDYIPIYLLPNQPPLEVSDSPIRYDFSVQGWEKQSVPAGTFKVLKLSRRVNQNQVYDYFAAGIGLVKRQNLEGTHWELTEFSGLKPSP